VGEFARIGGMWGDGADLYVSDNALHVIRKVSLSSGMVTDFAGLAESSGSEDGAASEARFDKPSGVWGNFFHVFVADSFNGAIRRINKITGEVTTVLDDDLDCPEGIWGDGSFLYIVNAGSHSISRFSFSSGEVEDFAGVPDSAGDNDGAGNVARFRNPRDIWGDGTYLYVTDMGNHSVRRIHIATRQVETFAGFTNIEGAGNVDGMTGYYGSAQFDAPVGIFGDGRSIYVGDSNNHAVRKIVPFQGTQGALRRH
jgi:hypothetical protein